MVETDATYQTLACGPCGLPWNTWASERIADLEAENARLRNNLRYVRKLRATTEEVAVRLREQVRFAYKNYDIEREKLAIAREGLESILSPMNDPNPYTEQIARATLEKIDDSTRT